ncbi:F-box domain containing protein [Tanacetum coccineum]
MSENIPFDLQLAIMNRLPVKSLLQFRTVSKSWKYSIDCSEFVREYGFRESNNCCLYLTFKQNFEGVICSVDDNLALSPVCLVPLVDAIQERDTILMYTHHNRLHVYVSRVELSPLVVAEQHSDETNKNENQGKPSCAKKLFD